MEGDVVGMHEALSSRWRSGLPFPPMRYIPRLQWFQVWTAVMVQLRRKVERCQNLRGLAGMYQNHVIAHVKRGVMGRRLRWGTVSVGLYVDLKRTDRLLSSGCKNLPPLRCFVLDNKRV